MNNWGGLFLGQQLPPKGDENPREVIRQYGLVWGRAVRDAQDTLRKHRRVNFLVKYSDEPNSNYGKLDKRGKPEKARRPLCVECYATGYRNVTAVMAATEVGDIVVCLGRVKSQKQKTKRGEMWFRHMNVDVIIPAGVIDSMFGLMASKPIQDILEQQANDAPDEWED